MKAAALEAAGSSPDPGREWRTLPYLFVPGAYWGLLGG